VVNHGGPLASSPCFSSGVEQPIPNLGQSNAVRASIVGWSKSLANEVAAAGITVNCVVPGMIETKRTSPSAHPGRESALGRRHLDREPNERMRAPDPSATETERVLIAAAAASGHLDVSIVDVLVLLGVIVEFFARALLRIRAAR